MVFVLDNYDSFTYNLVQYFGELGVEQSVFRNDKISIEEALALKPDRLMISPGPCSPNEAGVSLEMIEAFAGKIPILGVCLGHQSIGQYFGGDVVRVVARTEHHGAADDDDKLRRLVKKQARRPIRPRRARMVLQGRDT